METAVDFGRLDVGDILPSMASYAKGEYELPSEGDAILRVVDFGPESESTYKPGTIFQKVVFEILEPEDDRGLRVHKFMYKDGVGHNAIPEMGAVVEGFVFHKAKEADGRQFASVAFVPPAGTYEMELVDIGPPSADPENPKRVKRTLTFRASIPGTYWDGYLVRQQVTWSNHEQARLHKIINSLVGGKQNPDDTYAPVDLVGRRLMGTIVWSRGDQAIYANLGDTSPIVTSRLKKPTKDQAPF